MFRTCDHKRPAPQVLAALAAVAILVTALASCGEKDSDKQADKASQDTVNAADKEGPDSPGGKATADAVNAADSLKKGVASAVDTAAGEQQPLTPEAYEKLLLDMATCGIKGEQIDPACPAKKAFRAARSRRNALKNLAGLTAQLGKKHIKHSSPAVRVQAAGFLASIFGADTSSQDVIIEAAMTEQEPAVLVAMIQSVGSKGGRNPKIGELLLKLAGHENSSVRKKAMVWLGSVWNKDLAGSIEKIIETIENDKDESVRQFACRYSGARGDDRMVPIYKKYTAKPEENPKLYAACMDGLVNSFMHYPLFGTHSEKAYKLAMKRLAHKPRSQTVPPWGLLDNFAEIAKETPKVTEWRAKATWFKIADVMKVLEPIVIDRAAYRLARSGALKSMVALGASKKQLQRMRKSYDGSENPDDKSVIQQLDKAIAGE